MATSKKTTQTKKNPASKVTKTSAKADTSPKASGHSSKMTKEQQVKFFIIVVIGLILAGLYYYRGQFIVATVNGTPITRYEVIRELEQQAGQATIDSIISRKLIVQKAENDGIEVSQEDIDAKIKEIEDELASSGQSLDELLELQGVSRAQVEEQTKIQIMLEKLLSDKTSVTDEEVQAAVEQQSELMPEGMTPEEFAQQIESNLKDQKFAFEVQNFIQELQNSASINYLKEF